MSSLEPRPAPARDGRAAEPSPPGGPADASAPLGRKARTRQTLLTAAGDLFAKQGVERTTVEEIADAAGLSVGSIYKHFANKEALAIAFIDEALAIAEVYLEEALQAERPVDRVLNAGDGYFRFARENAAACRFVTMRALEPAPGTGQHPIDLALAKRIQRILLAIATNLKAAMDSGQVRRMPLDEAMVFLAGAWSGVAHLVIRQDPIRIPPDLAERALVLGRTILLEALQPREAAADAEG